MKRRRFLQLAASAAAALVVKHVSAPSCFAAQISSVAPADVLSLAVGEPGPTVFSASQVGFAPSRRSPVEPDQMIGMLLEQRSDGVYQWIIDGRPQPAESLLLQQGRRYRLRMMNATGAVHTVQLRHHRFELARIRQIPVSGIFKDRLCLERYNVVEADLLMTCSGPVLLQYPGG